MEDLDDWISVQISKNGKARVLQKGLKGLQKVNWRKTKFGDVWKEVKGYLGRTDKGLCVRSDRRWEWRIRFVDSLGWEGLRNHIEFLPIQEASHLTPKPDACFNWILDRGLEYEAEEGSASSCQGFC